MTTPTNATAAAVALRDKALTAFNFYQSTKDGDDPSMALSVLALAASYCVRLL